MNKPLRLLSLFSGIGGIDLAAEWAGYEIVGQVEIDPFCQAVLAKHWPDVLRMSDVRKVQGNEFGPIDVIAAGFPCQPHSVAGKRQASSDDRDVWPEIRRILGTAHPRWFVGENVPGLLTSEAGRFFGGILSDLVTLGYRVGWAVYGAYEVGAPHRRERLFLVASSFGEQSERGRDSGELAGETSTNPRRAEEWQWLRDSIGDGGAAVADTESTECEWADPPWTGRTRLANCRPSVADANCSGQQECNLAAFTTGPGHPARPAHTPIVENPPGGRERQHCRTAGEEGTQPVALQPGTGAAESGVCRDTHGISSAMDRHRWPALPGEPQEEWEPPRTITSKSPFRNQRLKALGNAVVPAQIYPLLLAIAEREAEINRGEKPLSQAWNARSVRSSRR